MEKKMAMIGGKTSTIGFKAVGIEHYPVAYPGEAPGTWESMPLEKYAVVIVTEPAYRVLAAEVAEFPPEGLPVVLVVPAVAGSTGLGADLVKDRVEKAVGVDLEG